MPAETRIRLGDAEVAALARVSFGLGDAGPELLPADEYEDAQGVLVAVREGAGWSSSRSRAGGPRPTWRRG